MLSEVASSPVARPNAGVVAAHESEVFLKALVAGYALMAHADGELANAERRRFMAIIRDTPAFEAFSQGDVAEEVAAYEASFRDDVGEAKRAAWDKLDAVAGQRRAAHVLVAACRELIAADGVAHPAEYRMLSTIKSHLGIDGLPPYA